MIQIFHWLPITHRGSISLFFVSKRPFRIWLISPAFVPVGLNYTRQQDVTACGSWSITYHFLPWLSSEIALTSLYTCHSSPQTFG